MARVETEEAFEVRMEVTVFGVGEGEISDEAVDAARQDAETEVRHLIESGLYNLSPKILDVTHVETLGVK